MNSIILVSALALLAGETSFSSAGTPSPVAQITVTAARACFATHRASWLIASPPASFSVFSLTPVSLGAQDAQDAQDAQSSRNTSLSFLTYLADALGSRGQPA